jgi:predicted glycosyltransferase
MKKKILFMLQNGIGFGHFKLALTISKHLEDQYEIVFLTQAKSTKIFNNFDYRVYNFPMLYTIHSNTETLFFNKLLNQLIKEINPSIVIEDTYPEDNYLNLPSLINIPRLLLINRLIGSEFEEYYFSGILNLYNKLIVLNTRENFIEDLLSLEVKNYAKYSNKFKYYDSVFNIPTKEIEEEMKDKYAIDNFDKTIVVNCGAGGWHIGTNICKEIFAESIRAANRIVKSGRNIQMILVLGPYSKYLKEDLSDMISYTDNIKLVDFEINLDALFHVVDLNILRPGYNSTMEAISGDSNILLLPGISYMESQEDWCRELARDYGIEYLNVDEISKIHSRIINLLGENTRSDRKLKSNSKKVALEIKNSIEKEFNELNLNLAFNISTLKNTEAVRKVKEFAYNNKISIIDDNRQLKYKDIKVKIINNEDKEFNDNIEAVVIYNDESLEFKRIDFYEKRYSLNANGIIALEFNEVKLTNKEDIHKKIINILTTPEKYSNKIVINIEEGTYKHIYENLLSLLEEMLRNEQIKIDTLSEIFSNKVSRRASDFKWNYYRSEITKLK